MKKTFLILIFMILFNSKAFSQAVGTEAPNFSHNTLSHGTISLSEYRGKVVYLFFFGYA
jgi:hypothetical protein